MASNNLTVVLDTNVLIVSVLPRFKYHWIFKCLIDGQFQLVVSTDVLAEYEEQLGMRYGLSETERQLDFLLMLPNVQLVTPYFQWGLIERDADDNKFVDCAIAGNADFIVTEDKHFDVLRYLSFPRMGVLSIQDFKELIRV